MEGALKERWNKIQSHQAAPLIGTKKPNEGNGYHDRMIAKDSYYAQAERKDYDSWIYSVYLRDLAQLIDPSYKTDEGESIMSKFKLSNVSAEFNSTLNLYLSKERWKSPFVNLASNLTNSLLYHGRVVIEIVGWFSNEDDLFYGFQLNEVDERKCKFQDSELIYQASMGEEKLSIPLTKFVIIDWPDELGGYQNYLEVVSRAIRSKKHEKNAFSSITNNNPSEALKLMKKGDLDFNQAIMQWGTNNLPEGVTEFFKQCLNIRLKLTTLYCLEVIFNGIEKIIKTVGDKFGEKPVIDIEELKKEIVAFEELNDRWVKGDVSFKEANAKLKFW